MLTYHEGGYRFNSKHHVNPSVTLAVAVHPFNPTNWEEEAGGSQLGHCEFEAISGRLSYIVRQCLEKQNRACKS